MKVLSDFLLLCSLIGYSVQRCPSGHMLTDLRSSGCFWCGTTFIVCAGSRLTEFPQLPQDSQTIVEILELGQNAITTIRATDLQNFSSLDTLYLYENHLESIEPGSFSGTTSLTSLYVQNNRLTDIPDNLFENSSIHHLDLSDNHIQHISAATFYGLMQDATINLRDNMIRRIPNGTFSSNYTLTLTGNPFHCDCELRHFQSFVASNRVQNIVQNSALGTCMTPANLTGRTLESLMEEELVCDCTQGCVNGICDLTMGECNCNDGYIGRDCSIPCPTGTFGAGCLQNCTCVAEQESSPCDNVDGICHCIPGYIGDSCEQAYTFNGCPAITNDPFSALPGVVFDWPETEIGNAVPYPCPCRNILGLDSSSEKRNGSRKCGGTHTHGAMWEPLNVIEDCRLSDIVLKLCHARLTNNSEGLADTLVNATSNPDEIEAVDISAATTLIEELAEAIQAASHQNKGNVIEKFLRTTDNLIQADLDQIVQSQKTARTSTRLLQILVEFSDTVQVPNTTNSRTFVQRSFAIHVSNIDTSEFKGETLTADIGSVDGIMGKYSEITQNSISVSSGISNNISTSTVAVRVPRTIFEELGLNKSEVQRLSYSVFTQGSLFQSLDENQANLTLGSVVASVRVHGAENSSELTKPIEVQFQSSQLAQQFPDTPCGLWNEMSNDGLGAWSMESCKLVNKTNMDPDTSKHVQSDDVNCNNPTNVFVVHYTQPGHFGLLLDLTYGHVESPPHTFTLEVITYMALPLSLICMVIFVVTYLSNKQLRNNEHGQILINMCFTLMCLYVIFLIGAHAAPVPAICGISAALLQYFMLVFFMWTVIEAVYLHRNLVKVLGTHIPKFVLKTALVAWTVPWPIVILSAGLGYKSYYLHQKGSSDVSTCNNTSDANINTTNTAPSGFCRAVGLPFWIGTVLPFVVTYVFNWTVFIVIVVSLYRNGWEKIEKNANKEEKMKFVKQQLTIAFGLATLFGLGWGFGLAASGTTIHGLTLAFQIIFSILVGFQGVLFFVLHGLKKQEARNQWIAWFMAITKWSFGFFSNTTDSKVTYSSYNMTALQKDSALATAVLENTNSESGQLDKLQCVSESDI